MDKNKAKAKYNSKVEKNLNQDFWNYESKDKVIKEIEKKGIYVDPDEAYEVSVCSYENILELESKKKTSLLESVLLSSDGLCGIKKIIEFSNSMEEAKYNYQLIRKGMFECLIWPSHSLNLNICRGFKSPFDDRIDLALIDIQSFYEKINTEKQISISLINDIKNDIENCLLSRAYLNLMTFTWLSSFGDFNNFIKERKLGVFVNNIKGNFKAEKWSEWDDDSKRFDDRYFKELIARVQKYRTENNIY